MSDAWANLAVGAGILLTGLSLALAALGLVSYARMRMAKLLLVSFAFLGFAAQGAYLTWLAWSRAADVASGAAGEFPVLILADLAIVLLLYLAVVKR